jgi:hypothetical protein
MKGKSALSNEPKLTIDSYGYVAWFLNGIFYADNLANPANFAKNLVSWIEAVLELNNG